MSWAAHQFEIYAVQAHLPKKMQRQGQLLRHLLRRLHARLPVEVLGVRHHDQRPPLRLDGAPQVAPRLARHGHHPHVVPRHRLRRGHLECGSATARSRSATSWASPRTRSPTSTTSVGTMLLFPFTTLSWTVADVGLRGDDRRRQVPRRRVVLLEPRSRDGPVLAGRRAVLVARAHPRVLAHQHRARRRAHMGHGSAAGSPNGPAGAVPGDVLLRRVPADRRGRPGPTCCRTDR